MKLTLGLQIRLFFKELELRQKESELLAAEAAEVGANCPGDAMRSIPWVWLFSFICWIQSFSKAATGPWVPATSLSDVGVPAASLSDLGVPAASLSDLGVPAASCSNLGVPAASYSNLGFPAASHSDLGVPAASLNEWDSCSLSVISWCISLNCVVLWK